MSEEILFRLIIGPVFIGIIIILLIIFNLKKRKKENTNNKVDYGRVYYQMVLLTFVVIVILCDNIYEFLLFQASLILSAILISKDINDNMGKMDKR